MTTESTDGSRWLVLVNPKAGNSKGLHDWDEISGLLAKYGIGFTHHFTDYARHAVVLAKEMVMRGFQKIIVVGGDGFLNETVNGIFSQSDVDTRNITLAMIPVGTGNDWVRTFNIPFDYEGAVKVIRSGKTIMHDIGRVFYQLNNTEHSWYFINICGIGFDAEVNKKVNADKGHSRTGPLKYQYHIFTTLIGYHPTKVVLQVDGKSYTHELFSGCIGIAKYNGGGMKQLPNAIVDDGIFDISFIDKISRLKVMRHTKDLYDGSFIHLPEVSTYTGVDIRLDSEPKIWLEGDGEALGHSPFRFEILPKSLRVVTG
jgi:YegS/Rv2252/BmrU family lipid kinase